MKIRIFIYAMVEEVRLSMEVTTVTVGRFGRRSITRHSGGNMSEQVAKYLHSS